jgi:3-deoxy-D-manno-octulosonic-acid transferase
MYLCKLSSIILHLSSIWGTFLRYLYTVLFYLALPLVFLRLLWRSRRSPLYRRRWLERLGFSSYRLEQCILVHAVSLGETIAAVPLIKALRTKYPTIPLLVTNMTVTGSARVKAVFGDEVLNTYIPYDLPAALNRFFVRVKPKIVIVMETELWPNLFAVCKKNNIPLVVANARLSARSAKKYRLARFVLRQLFAAITMLAAQTKADADRFIALGMPEKKIKITGSLKFDIEFPKNLLAQKNMLRAQLGEERLIWIAASTHAGEDEKILAAHRLITAKIPQALLILVPRHPERFDFVATLVTTNGFKLARRGENAACDQATSVYLGDTLGEMLTLYAVSDVAFVAGSFAPIGGHNMIEPAALHKPIITGPSLFNFAEISDVLQAAGGLLKVTTSDQLANAVIKLFENTNQCQLMGKNAFKVVEENRGALDQQVEMICRVISNGS